MGRRGQGFSTKRRQKKQGRRKSKRTPRRRGQLTQRVCALCEHAMTDRGLCSNRGCSRSYPKPTSNPVAADMRQREGSGLWVPPWHGKE